jgi:hypothetical protein
MGLWGAPLKLILDQTIYAAIYNCVFFFGIGGAGVDAQFKVHASTFTV